jgi:hypothetical protein
MTRHGIGMGVAFALGAAALSLGCGDEATAPAKGGHEPSVTGLAGAATETGDDDEMPRRVELAISVAGSDEPIRATVSERGGAIEVTSAPDELELPILYGPLPLGFEDAFSDEFCKAVRLSADTNAHTETDLVRRGGSVTARVPVSSLVWPETLTSAMRAAQDAGVSSGVFWASPFTLTDAKLSIELAPDAVSRALGVDTLSHDFEQELSGSLDAVAQIGSFQISLPAKDLWCDLAQRKATLRIAVTGELGSEEYSGETRVTGVAPIP